VEVDSAVAPSPIQAEAILVSPLIAEAMAQPTCTNWVARLPLMVKKPASRTEYMIGNWRPLSGSRSLDSSWQIISTSDTSRAIRMLCWR
jgi:hypothetical protein